MRLGQMIKKYRNDNGLSLRDFARVSGVSNSYISMLETGRQPTSGRPVVPTLTKLNQIAAAMNVRVDDLIVAIEDPVGSAADFSDLERLIIDRFRGLSEKEKEMILRSLNIEL